MVKNKDVSFFNFEMLIVIFNLLKLSGGMISYSAMFGKFKHDSFDIIN